MGVGGREHDYRAIGGSFDHRWQRMDEQVARMRRVWAGEPPFAAFSSPYQKLKAQAGAPVPPIRERRPEVPLTLVAALERMLAKDGARPIIFYNRSASCWQPYVKGLTIMVNSISNGWRMEDVWLDK